MVKDSHSPGAHVEDLTKWAGVRMDEFFFFPLFFTYKFEVLTPGGP